MKANEKDQKRVDSGIYDIVCGWHFSRVSSEYLSFRMKANIGDVCTNIVCTLRYVVVRFYEAYHFVGNLKAN